MQRKSWNKSNISFITTFKLFTSKAGSDIIYVFTLFIYYLFISFFIITYLFWIEDLNQNASVTYEAIERKKKRKIMVH